MKTKKVMAMLLCAAMGLSLLSGCGNDGEEVKTSTQEPQQSEVAEKPAEEPVEETVEEVTETEAEPTQAEEVKVEETDEVKDE